MQTQLLKFKEFLLLNKQRETYYNYMLPFINFLAKNNYTLENINKDIIVEYLKVNEKWSSATLNLFLASGRKFYSFIFGDKDSPFKNFKSVKVEQKIKDYPSPEEWRQGINYLIAETRLDEVKIRALLAFMIDTGLRISEFEFLKRINIDLTKDPAEAIIRVPTKGKKERLVLITPETVKLIENYFKQEPESFNAFNIKIHQVRYITKLLKKLFPTKHLTPHSLRHTMARMWDKKGVRLTAISQMLGHTNIETTATYLRLSDDEIRKHLKEVMNKPKKEK